MCEDAEKSQGKRFVLVIDELSRSDPARVFGEALTYIEVTKREKKFRLASGTEASMPKNLIFLATMNPMDRGVDEVDAALERRFAKIAMEPDGDNLRAYLAERGFDDNLLNRLIGFFNYVNSGNNKNAQARVGHAYFYGVRDEAGMKRLWDHQLLFLFEKAYRLDQDGLAQVTRRWARVFEAAAAPVAEPAIVPASVEEE